MHQRRTELSGADQLCQMVTTFFCDVQVALH
jgi:hypothetical protein